MNRIENWIALWIDLAETIVGLITLAFYTPHWSLDFRVWWFKSFVYKHK